MLEISAIKERLRILFPGGHPDFIDLTIDEMELHSKKNTEYTGAKGDPLGNFKRVAKIFELYPNLRLTDPVVGALFHLMKQLDATLRMLDQEYEGQIEGKAERLGDVSVYAKLARILVMEENSDREV